MNRSKKALYILLAIIAFIFTVEAYLIVKQHYILASSIIIAIIMACGLGTFVFNKQIAGRFFQQEILRYLTKNNNETTLVEIIDHFRRASGGQDKTAITQATCYAIEKLIQKNMIVNNQGKVRKVT